MKITHLFLVSLLGLYVPAWCPAAEGDPDYEFSKATMKQIVAKGQEPIAVFTKNKGVSGAPGGSIGVNADGSVENKGTYILFTTGVLLSPGGKYGPIKTKDVFFNIADLPVQVGDFVLKKGEAVLYNGKSFLSEKMPKKTAASATIGVSDEEYARKYGEPFQTAQGQLDQKTVLRRAFVKKPYMVMTYSHNGQVVCAIYRKRSVNNQQWEAMNEDERAALVEENAPPGEQLVEVPSVTDNTPKSGWIGEKLIAAYRPSDFMLIIKETWFDLEKFKETAPRLGQ